MELFASAYPWGKQCIFFQKNMVMTSIFHFYVILTSTNAARGV